MKTDHVVVIGAGMGGLSAAIDLAARGMRVTVVERAGRPGGKMREVPVAGARIDGGPTVFTMRWVFEDLFATAGESLADHLALTPAEVLARHAWVQGGRFDLFADLERSVDSVGAFAGPDEARRYRAFCARAKQAYDTLEGSFIKAPRPNPVSLVARAGLKGLPGMTRNSPFSTLWKVLGEHFHDPRLQQLFGRYATYCGSSPFLAPAVLTLIAHVEQEGVWLVDGGMARLAEALAALAERQGVTLRYGAEAARIQTRSGRASGLVLADGEEIAADAIIVNADASALAAGTLGPEVTGAVPGVPLPQRSQSAITWTAVAETEGFPLSRHTVFFSDDYKAEFDDVFDHRRPPLKPTVYVCAQDRDAADGPPPQGPERLLVLINAPATGDSHPFDDREIEQCTQRTFALMEQCGLSVRLTPEATTATSPAGFERLFPATGGALYGRANHGWAASFQRPAARTKVPGLYLAGGSVHPGPGAPMAALSGRLAADALVRDRTSRKP